jgi:lipopolysaccharide/colanic/teichoic acid biosynthesis glycosyltransferase/anti-anti-sigma regulatory factor
MNTHGVTLTEYRGLLVIGFPRRFTVSEAVAFRDCLADHLPAHGGVRKVVLDFSRTQLIDSSGLGSLIANIKLARARRVPVEVWSAGSQVRLALSLVGLESQLLIPQGTAAIDPVPPRADEPRAPITHPSVRCTPKRLLDVVGSLVGLAVLAVLLPFIALAIRLDSPGPLFFSQQRLGWMGRPFRLWKFRSMVTNAEELRDTVANEASGAFFKNRNDPRVTRVGRFLRRTSLDELPQFWNVLRGEMSLVGTRPPTPDEVERYAVPSWQRLDVRPGMTGEWQVHGRSRITAFEEVIRLDLRYQERWSLAYDMALILRTLGLIFSPRSGAV